MAKRVPALSDVPRVITNVIRHPSNRRRRFRQVMRVIHFRTRAMVGRPTLVPLGRSSRLRASLAYPNSIVAAYANPPDAAEWAVWSRHLRPGDVFVDVGANVGVYAILAAELGCSVIAFEPDADNLRELEFNITLNGYEERISVIPMAAADKPGSVSFTVGEGPFARIAPTGGSGTTDVMATTIDSLVQGPVAGMKIDVEGAELMVLIGADRLFSEGRCALVQVEWNLAAQRAFGRSRTDEAQFLVERGYDLFRPELDGQLVPSSADVGRDIFARRTSRTTNRGTVAPS